MYCRNDNLGLRSDK